MVPGPTMRKIQKLPSLCLQQVQFTARMNPIEEFLTILGMKMPAQRSRVTMKTIENLMSYQVLPRSVPWHAMAQYHLIDLHQ